MTTRRYAEGTEVSASRSREEIERTIQRFGATSHVWMRDDVAMRVVVAFKIGQRSYRFILPLPAPSSPQITQTPSRRWSRDEKQQRDALEAETRRRFRSLANYLKAMLDAIETGILHEETALMPYLLLASGRTVAEDIAPQIARALEAGEGLGLRLALAPPEEARR